MDYVVDQVTVPPGAGAPPAGAVLRLEVLEGVLDAGGRTLRRGDRLLLEPPVGPWWSPCGAVVRLERWAQPASAPASCPRDPIPSLE